MTLFHDNFDRVVFLRKLKSLQNEYKFRLLAYSLMSNHIHMIFMDNGITLPIVMNCLLDYYAKYYNAKYNHRGHVFEGPYKSKIIIGLMYLFTLYRYILRNPVSAKLIKDIFDFYWTSSKPEYDTFELVDFDYIYESYKEFSEEPIEDFLRNCKDDDKICELEIFRITDMEAKEMFKEMLLCIRKDDVQFDELEIETRDKLIQKANHIGLSIRQLSLITGITSSRLQTICSKSTYKYL